MGGWPSPRAGARATGVQSSRVWGKVEREGARTVTSGFLGEKTGEQPGLPKNRYHFWLLDPPVALVPASEPLRAEFAYHSIYKVQSGVKPPK